jgi:integrase
VATLTKRGSRWRAQVRRPGHKSLSKSFPTRKAAEVWARDVEAQLDKHLSVDVGLRITFSELMRSYREDASRKGFSPSKHRALKKIELMLGSRRLVELNTSAFRTFCKTREEEGAGPPTILQDLSYIGTSIRYGSSSVPGAKHAAAAALAELDAARRSLRHAGRVARPEERDRRPTDTELRALLDHWSASPRQAMIPMIDITLFAIATAMRLGEIVSLRWEDLNEENRTILIRERKHPTKKLSNHQRVPLLRGPCIVGGRLIDPLEIILRQRSAWTNTGRIFPYVGQSISKAFQRAIAAAEIEDLHFHDLRHDAASRLFEAGYPIEQVALVTGHRSWNMLRRYTHLRAEDLHRSEAGPNPGAPEAPVLPQPAGSVVLLPRPADF